jgi:hypothetical protein
VPILATIASSTKQEQSAYLQLCILLLDYKLKGRLTNSILIRFLAANSITKDYTGFKEAVTAISNLSALIKIA